LAIPAQAQEPKLLLRALTDPAFLTSRTWKSDPGLDKAVSDWPLYDGKQEFEDKTVLRRVEFQVAGVVFEAQYRVFLKDPFAEIVLLSGGKFDESFCVRFSEWTKPMFGVPAKVIDMSLPPRKDEAYIQLEADWLLGATRIQFFCAGARIGDSFVPGAAYLLYSHQTMLKALEDLIYIECSSTTKYVGRLAGERGTTEEDVPTRFMINPNDNSVRGWDKEPIKGKMQRYSDEEIVTTWSDKKYSSVLRLDRRAGSYLIQTRLKGDERSGLDRWGKCSRTTSEKKF
jgi:hypothetical protein